MKKIKELEEFSIRVKELRKENHRRQSDMAALLECTTSHYQKIEYGQVNIPVTTLMTLAEYFGVTTDYLLGLSDCVQLELR